MKIASKSELKISDQIHSVLNRFERHCQKTAEVISLIQPRAYLIAIQDRNLI